MKNLDSKMIKKFLEKAQKKLSGEWVLLGGTLLPFLEIDHRVTTDIDFVGLTAKEQSQNLVLMEISEELGLPVETINQAAAFYLQKIKGYKEDLEPIFKSKDLEIFRPNLKLFLKLKLSRLTEADFQDCLELLKIEKKRHDSSQLEKIILSFLKDQKDPKKNQNLNTLLLELKK